MRRANRLFPILLLAAPLAGCISFGAKPPPSLLTLTAATPLAVGATQRNAATLTLSVPNVPAELATQRVPVQASATSVAYLKDAVWVALPNRLFTRLLADTIEARTGRVVLDNRGPSLNPGASLSGDLRVFGVDAGSGEVVVTYDATLIRGTATTFEKRRFEARVPAGAIEAAAVGIALNQAANQVAGEVADWVGK